MGIKTVFLNIADGLCHLFQIAELHLPRIGRALLRLDAGLQIRDQMEIRANEQDRYRIGFVVVAGIEREGFFVLLQYRQ